MADLRKAAGLSNRKAEYVINVVPADDLGLRRLISHYYNSDVMLNGDEVRGLTRSWEEWKGLAVYYLLVDWLIKSGRMS